jgi:hypothetical protein
MNLCIAYRTSGMIKAYMSIEAYVEKLEEQVPSWVVSTFGSWPVETRLYMYLHHLQLARMDEFVQLLKAR